MKKYELMRDQMLGKLYRIRALVDLPGVKPGDIGGYVEGENNLSQEGAAWIYGDAWISGNARISGNAQLFWASKVGSDNGTLAVYKSKDGVLCTRGCFLGTPDEFLAAVAERHGGTKIETEYKLLIQVALSRLGIAQEAK